MAVTSLKRSSLKSIIKYDSLLAGNAAYSLNDFEHIQTITVGAGGAASVSFSSIPQTYKHLQIRGIGRSALGNLDDNVYARCNSDAASNYVMHQLTGNGSSATSTANTAQTALFPIVIPGSTSAADVFGVGVVDLLDYTSTSKYKTFRMLSGVDRNGSGYALFRSGLWMSTSAVTSLTLYASANMAQFSSFSLYGIKG